MTIKIILMATMIGFFLALFVLLFLIIRSGRRVEKTLDETKKDCDEASEIARSWMRGGTDDQLPKG